MSSKFSTASPKRFLVLSPPSQRSVGKLEMLQGREDKVQRKSPHGCTCTCEAELRDWPAAASLRQARQTGGGSVLALPTNRRSLSPGWSRVLYLIQGKAPLQETGANLQQSQ